MDNLVTQVRSKMNQALKNRDMETKRVYSGILDALNKETKELRVIELTPEQEVSVISSMIKKLDDAINKCPASRPEYAEKLMFEKSIIMQYMPKQMGSDEISKIIQDILDELNIVNPTKSDKGKIMKLLMPLVKGKADGKLVNELVTNLLQ